MGKRTLENRGKKLNCFKVFCAILTIMILIAVVVFSVNEILNSDKNEEEKENNFENNFSVENEQVEEKTMEDVVAEFGAVIIENVKDDTCYASKDGKDYTIYLDGEIVEGKIVPWNGDETKPAIEEDGNISIYKASELAWVANRVTSGEKNFSGITISLKNNIDLGARIKEDGSWEGNNWNAIIGFLDEIKSQENSNKEKSVETTGTEENSVTTNENLKRFAGTFNGNNFSIRGMKIENNKRYQGLFGALSGTITDLTIKYSKINGGDTVGAIVGLNEGNISNCKVENTEISGTKKVGGIAGVSMTGTTIDNSETSETTIVTGETYVGGIIGYINNNAIIKNCKNFAEIKGKEYVGGVTGIAFYGTELSSCFNGSKTINGENYIGGIAGYSAAHIVKSYNQNLNDNNCVVTGKNYVGGIVGLNYEMGDITECFNNGKIIVLEDNCGGIVGLNNATISNCYNKGEIDCTQTKGLKIGGICGQNTSECSIYNSYNIGKINNVSYAGGIVGADFGTISNSFCLENCLSNKTGDINYNKTEEEMKNSIFENLGICFKHDSENVNDGYPILNWQ